MTNINLLFKETTDIESDKITDHDDHIDNLLLKSTQVNDRSLIEEMNPTAENKDC